MHQWVGIMDVIVPRFNGHHINLYQQFLEEIAQVQSYTHQP